jgi:hypothetical protein
MPATPPPPTHSARPSDKATSPQETGPESPSTQPARRPWLARVTSPASEVSDSAEAVRRSVRSVDSRCAEKMSSRTAFMIKKTGRPSVKRNQSQADEPTPCHSYDFLVNIPWTEELSRIAEIVRGHHEKLDGSGYPDGVTGEHLSLETRIMTVCDIFDALTASDRPYKKAMPTEKALQVLQWEAKDGMLDTDIVDLFIASGVYKKVLDRDWREF